MGDRLTLQVGPLKYKLDWISDVLVPAMSPYLGWMIDLLSPVVGACLTAVELVIRFGEDVSLKVSCFAKA